jgi:DNA-binding NarL/FixJ family response regulator
MISTVDSQVFSETEWTELQRTLGLSRRQSQIVEQLLCGRSDKQIARELEVSVPTVRTHLGRLFMRFGVADRCELIVHMFACFRERCRQCGCPRCI